MKMNCIDLHCHLMPYVDDGASDLDEAMELLKMEAQQGVDFVCLTPHLRDGMFGTPDEKIRAGYDRLVQLVQTEEIPLTLYLGREYYFDSEFCKCLEAREVLPLGEGKSLLVEFSYTSSVQTLLEAAEIVLKAGYQPVFAHVERYRAVRENPDLLKELSMLGVKIQMNASSLLGTDGWGVKLFAWKQVRRGVIDVIASDAHSVEFRSPNLDKCKAKLEKKLGREAAQRLLYDNPLAILKAPVEE